MFLLPSVFYIVLVAIAVAAGGYDFVRRRIPNWITLPGLLAGLVLNAVRDQWSGLEFALLGTGVALAVYIPLYLLRAMGAGDVKLMAAIGAVVGPVNWIFIFLAAAVIGGAIAGVMVLKRHRFHDTMLNLWLLLGDFVQLRAPYRTHPQLDVRGPDSMRLPHGVAIASGALITVALTLVKPL